MQAMQFEIDPDSDLELPLHIFECANYTYTYAILR